MNPDNIMLDAAGQPVNVPGVPVQNVVATPTGAPVVPTGVEPAMNQAPKDTLPRPAPLQPMPVQQVPEQPVQATPQPNAPVESVITFDELAAKKGFNSPDDLAKSYVNLESQNKRVEVTLADAINARITPPVEQIPTQPVQPVPAENAGADENAALEIVDSRIASKLKKHEDIMDYKMHLIQNPTDQQFAAEAVNVVKDNPGIKWGTAFEAAKARMGGIVTQQTREDGKNEAYANIALKQNAQAIPGNAQRPNSFALTPKDVIENVKTGKISLSETRNIINSLSKDIK
ncbi:MAG: hypothetical protein KAU20_07530 [Nanoarchaeota archaeon]|nr:hypothetical protein [Nanoarchaeota archaeon]